ncbi:hypothetical protein HAX54_012923, partial [Datura stramonium]|nr:hypothetical protein [Datura stramonium]
MLSIGLHRYSTRKINNDVVEHRPPPVFDVIDECDERRPPSIFNVVDECDERLPSSVFDV